MNLHLMDKFLYYWCNYLLLLIIQLSSELAIRGTCSPEFHMVAVRTHESSHFTGMITAPYTDDSRTSSRYRSRRSRTNHSAHFHSCARGTWESTRGMYVRMSETTLVLVLGGVGQQRIFIHSGLGNSFVYYCTTVLHFLRTEINSLKLRSSSTGR